MSSPVSTIPGAPMSPLLATANLATPTSALNERIKLQRGLHLTPQEVTRGSFSSGKVSDHSSPSPSPIFSDAEDHASSSDTPTSFSRASNTTQSVSPRQLLFTLPSPAPLASNESLAISAGKLRFVPLPSHSEELRNGAQSPQPVHFPFS